MHNPPHPGFTLRDDVLPALGLNVTGAARELDVSRVSLSRVLNGRAAISPEMALRLEAWLGKDRGGDARLWLAQQNAYDMGQAAQRLKESKTHVQPAPLAVENPWSVPSPSIRRTCPTSRVMPLMSNVSLQTSLPV